MYQNNVKSATTAGLLGIFLGQFGAHWWYLGVKKKAIIHVALVGGAFVLFAISGILTASMASSLTGIYAGLSGGFSAAAILTGLGSLTAAGNGVWALVEAIIILSKGDAGLSAMGIPVAAPVAQPGYGQPGQAAPGYGAPMQAQPGAQPMQAAAPEAAPAPAPEQGANSVAGVGVNPAPAAPVAPQPQAPAEPMDPAKKNG